MEFYVRIVRAGILHDIELNLPPKGVTVIVGPNGAGKTTLLKVVAGLVRGNAVISVNGLRLDKLPPEERRVGYVPQSLALFRHMTVYDNIAYGLRARGLGESEVREKVLSIASRLGILHLLNRKPWSLSGGEKQRVALARALVLDDVRILLLDEAFDHIDSESRHEILRFIGVEAERRGIPVLLVTHHPKEAIKLTGAKMLVELRRGKVVKIAVLSHNNDAPASSPRPYRLQLQQAL